MTAGRDLVFMCADTGTVVSMTPEWTLVFLTTGDTLVAGPRSTMARRYPAPVELVRGEPVTARAVPLNIAVTVEPATVEVALADDPARTTVAVRVSGEVTVGSVIRAVDGWGWLGPSEPVEGCRARAVFQDRSAAYVPGAGAGAVVVNTAIRGAPVESAGADDRRWRGVLGGRSPVRLSAEIRDTEQHLTFVEPAPDGDGWLACRAAPFVFVRSGITGLGLVESTTRRPAAHFPARDDLPDPY